MEDQPENYENVLLWVKMIYPDLSDQEAADKANKYAKMFQQTSKDLETFMPDPRAAHTADPRQAGPL